MNLSEGKRKTIQRNLFNNGYYSSSIDGLYGKSMARALRSYNNNYLGGADLSKSANAVRVVNALTANSSGTSPQPSSSTTTSSNTLALAAQPLLRMPSEAKAY